MYVSVRIFIAVVFIVIAILNESRADPESLSLRLKFELIIPQPTPVSCKASFFPQNQIRKLSVQARAYKIRS